MKKLLTILLLVFVFQINAFAAATNATEDQEHFEELKSKYESGLSTARINGNGSVTIYGYSKCNGTSCTYSYMDQSSSVTYTEILKKMVVCTGGETHIVFEKGASGGDFYKANNKANYTGEVYWSEDYDVTCTTSGEELDSSSGSSSGGSTSGGSSSSGSSSSGDSSYGDSTGSDYSSSTPGDQEQMGVETYYIVLGIIGILTYGIMMLVKKYNLFKNV